VNVAVRVPWRLLSFGIAWILAQGIAESVLGPLAGVVARRLGESLPVYPWSTLIGVAVACWVALRFVDDVPWSVMALGDGVWHWRRLRSGALLGATAILATALILWVAGALHFERVPTPTADGVVVVSDGWIGTALRLLWVLGPAALWEELVFRGYLYAVASEAAGRWVARLSSSVAFGAVHLMNPGANARTTVVVVLAGLCLCLVRERANSLPAAWSAHLAWNWVMAALLHVPVSGLPFATPGYRAVPRGSDWITGGAWGPEGGLVAMLVLGTAMAVGLRRRDGLIQT
jgi:membrane protease YdiL (CAAX protease family)